MIDVQRASDAPGAPDDTALVAYARATLAQQERDGALTLRLVDAEEGRALNGRYRGKDVATNVLAFPQDLRDETGETLFGDLVVCAPVVAREAVEQGKSLADHYAHMIVHGVLHLLGHDHPDAEQAEAMERLERDILATLGVPDPYQPITPHRTACDG